MAKQGTLHPRKHPCSSAGVVPEHTHKQTDSDTHRQIQTHTETHTPNGCFPSLKAPTFCPSTPLPPEPSLKQKQHHFLPSPSHSPHPIAVEGMDLGGHSLVPSHSTISEDEGYHEEPNVFHLRGRSEGKGPFTSY